MNVLPPPKFVDNDPAAIEADLIARYEAMTGKTLYPAQIERLLINVIAYAKSRTLSAVQHTGEMMLARRSQAPIIDYLGDLVGTQRLMPQAARCTLEFTLPAVQSLPLFVAFGTRVLSSDGGISFITDADLTIPPKSLTGQVTATCEVAGKLGNDWGLGTLSVLENPLVPGMLVRNITIPTSGADEEQTPAYAERIILAPEGYSTAGPGEAYEVWVRAVHQDIIDVAVLGPEDGLQEGRVEAYPLTKNGLPSPELLELVQVKLSDRKRRPLTDFFTACMPVEVPYTIHAGLTVLRGVDTDSVMEQAQAAAEAYQVERRSKLGRDLVCTQLIGALHVPGVYEVHLDESFQNRELAPHEWAVCTGISLHLVGIHDD